MMSLDTVNKYKTNSVNSQNCDSTLKIGLMGPFGGGNLGDAAIQNSAIANIRRLHPQAQIYGFSLKPKDTELRHGIPTYPIGKEANSADYYWWKGITENSLSTKLTNVLARWAKLPSRSLWQKISTRFIFGTLETQAWVRAYQNFQALDLDVLMVSGGGQLDDYWGGAWGHPFTLLRWCLFAKMNGTKFMIVSTGAGPIDSTLGKLFTRITLSLADYRSYRDADSKRYIQEVVGFRGGDDDLVCADLAFSLPIDSYQRTLENTKYRAVVGIGPMSYYHPQSWPEKDQSVYSEYLNKLASLTAWLSEQQYAIALFPGQTKHDKLAIGDFKQLLIEKGVPQEQIIERPILKVDDLMNQLADIDIAIASRFHGVLLSLFMNKPTLALSYHPKIDALMEDTGQGEYCLSIEDFELDTTKEKFTAIANNYRQIQTQLASKTQAYKSCLANQYEHLFGRS